jgi:predicted ATP-dependent endonuclease of OLD family
LTWPLTLLPKERTLPFPFREWNRNRQVLAILYVVLEEKEPRTIIIDEPQSFLHPGAIRKLFDILKGKDHAQHQYIVTTHSPTVITSASPATLLLVRKTEAENV